MKKILAIVAALGVVGCGPEFDGEFKGTYTISSICNDGSGGSQSVVSDWIVRETAGKLTIVTNGACSPLTATINGRTASVLPQSCQSQVTADGETWVPSATSGTLRLTDTGDLNIAYQLHWSFSGPYGTGYCDDTAANGLLARVN